MLPDISHGHNAPIQIQDSYLISIFDPVQVLFHVGAAHRPGKPSSPSGISDFRTNARRIIPLLPTMASLGVSACLRANPHLAESWGRFWVFWWVALFPWSVPVRVSRCYAWGRHDFNRGL